MRLGQDPVGKALDARPRHVALQLLDRRPIGERKFPRHDARERDVLIEDGADALRRNQQNARIGQCARGVQIGLVADHGGEDERRNRVDQGNSPFAAVLFGKDLDQAVDQDMQEIGVIALVDQDDAGRELLQQRCVEQALRGFPPSFRKTAAGPSTGRVRGGATSLLLVPIAG